jgi:hypothetical protein
VYPHRIVISSPTSDELILEPGEYLLPNITIEYQYEDGSPCKEESGRIITASLFPYNKNANTSKSKQHSHKRRSSVQVFLDIVSMEHQLSLLGSIIFYEEKRWK